MAQDLFSFSSFFFSNGHHSPFLVSWSLFFYFLERKELVGQLARVCLVHSDHVLSKRERNRRSRFILEHLVQYSLFLPSFYTPPFSLSDYSSTTRTLCAGCFGIPNAPVPRSSRPWIFNYFSFLFLFDRSIVFFFFFDTFHLRVRSVTTTTKKKSGSVVLAS